MQCLVLTSVVLQPGASSAESELEIDMGEAACFPSSCDFAAKVSVLTLPMLVTG